MKVRALLTSLLSPGLQRRLVWQWILRQLVWTLVWTLLRRRALCSAAAASGHLLPLISTRSFVAWAKSSGLLQARGHGARMILPARSRESVRAARAHGATMCVCYIAAGVLAPLRTLQRSVGACSASAACVRGIFALPTAQQVFAILACHGSRVGGDGCAKPRVNPSLVNTALAVIRRPAKASDDGACWPLRSPRAGALTHLTWVGT